MIVDIHTHILPGVDDGCENDAAAIALARAEARAGVSDIVATPHANAVYRRLSAAQVCERVERLRKVLARAGVPVRIWPGHEVALDADLEETLAQRAVATLNGSRYLLLELPSGGVPVMLPLIVARVRQRGIVPVIAHVERERAIQRAPDLLAPLVEAGALAQITASSLIGAFGARAQRTSALLLTHDLAHVLASDAHAIQMRPAQWTASLAEAERLVGTQRVRELVQTVPRAILEDRPIVTRAPLSLSVREREHAAAPTRRARADWLDQLVAASRHILAR